MFIFYTRYCFNKHLISVLFRSFFHLNEACFLDLTIFLLFVLTLDVFTIFVLLFRHFVK